MVRVLLRGFKNPGYWHRIPERFGFTSITGPVDIWVHAVSVGEARAAAPLVDKLLEQQPQSIILLTTMTPTGSETVKQLYAGNQRVRHCYVPYDLPDAMQRFIDRINPQRVIVLETELWPNLIGTCSRQAISLDYVNVRISEKSYQHYKWVGRSLARLLNKINSFSVQTQADAHRLKVLGVADEKITVTGNIKFDVTLPSSLKGLAEVLRREIGTDRPVWVAGSTHEGEEEVVLTIHQRLLHQFPNLMLILVPRHPERFANVTRLLETHGVSFVRRSKQSKTVARTISVYFGDTMGELNLFYAAADIAFVGGSLVATGGHNVLEPCALGVPVVFGPHMFHFSEIGKMVLAANGGIQVTGARELQEVISRWLENENLRNRIGDNARQLITDNRGALDRTLANLNNGPQFG